MMKLKPQLLSNKRHFCWHLRKLPAILFALCLVASCSDKKAGVNKKLESETTTAYENPPTPIEQQQKKILLCKINGEDWYYTEVRCRKILSTDYTPREKFVLNFKNTDTKAGESITLMYNVKTMKLEYVDAAIQAPNDEAGVRAFFGIKGYTDEELAQIKDIGMLTDVSGGNISGTASFRITKNSKGVFTNELNRDISITDFKFTNIPFEDVSDR